jgi:ABC-2 type transport system ATP-binding protein
MAEAFVQFEGVAKRYKSFEALRDVTFQLNEGEIFGYIGPNGAGKTTTLKLLVGLLRNFEGSIRVQDLQLPRDYGALHRIVGYLPQYPEFQAWRTVNHALMTLGRLSGVSIETLEKRIPVLLDRFELGNVRHKKVRLLSGGMKQKVGFVQAMLHNPKLLVLDEPLSGLDPDSRIRLKEQILELKNEGTTVIFSSHILGDVEDVTDRIGILKGGQMLKSGNLTELRRHFSVGKDVQIAFSSPPASVTYLNEIPGLQRLKALNGHTYVLSFGPQADLDIVVHDLILKSLAQGAIIRKVGEVVASLDELYKRFMEPVKNEQAL